VVTTFGGCTNTIPVVSKLLSLTIFAWYVHWVLAMVLATAEEEMASSAYSSVPRTAGLSPLKMLAVNLSWPSDRHGLYASIIGPEPSRLNAVDYIVCRIFFFLSFLALV